MRKAEDAPASREPGRFAALDLLRGTAALGVLVYHVSWIDWPHSPLPRAYLAVPLFFVLSGFVISHAYSHRLHTRRQFGSFCLARLIRLYPLYCLATLGAAAVMVAAALWGSGDYPHLTPGRVLSSLATAIFFLPTPPAWSVNPVAVFPLVSPAWSLFWELAANLLYALAITRLRPAVLALLMAIGISGVLVAELLYDFPGGPDWANAWAGGARALYSYFAGVALYKLRHRFRAPAVPALVLPIILVVAFLPGPGGLWWYDVTCIALLFPMLIWFGADAKMGRGVAALGSFAGFLSYPVYVLQAPVLLVLGALSTRVAFPGANALMPSFVAIATIVACSYVIARWFDSPLRERLRKTLIPHTPKPPAQTAP